MSKELLEELSRIQLLSARYKNKSRMCPLEVKREEVRSYILNEYIKQLKQALLDIKEYVESEEMFEDDYDTECSKILDVIDKALGSDSNECN